MYKIPANTLFLGKNLVFVPECHSTNTLALQLSQNSTSVEGTVLITDNQTAGRGQRGNTWEAEPGMNLTFSVILRPGFLPVKDQFFLTIITALAVRDLVNAKTHQPVHIKWPNDILISDKKICGILIENQIQGETLVSAVAGIGFNVNQTLFTIGYPTSLRIVNGQPLLLQDVLDELLGRLEARYLQLRQNNYSLLKKEYIDHLYWRNETRTFSDGNSTFEGSISGIDENGKLMVETQAGLRTFGMKEIQYIQ